MSQNLIGKKVMTQTSKKRTPLETWEFCNLNRLCPDFYNGIKKCLERQKQGQCKKLEESTPEDAVNRQ